jgi:hypothetical protein
LHEVLDELGVAAVAVDDDDALEPVPADLVDGGLQEVPDDAGARAKVPGCCRASLIWP